MLKINKDFKPVVYTIEEDIEYLNEQIYKACKIPYNFNLDDYVED